MGKKWLLIALLVFSVGFITACVESEETLSSITYSGTADATIENGVTFNFLTGVTAIGNNGVDYTSQIVITSTSGAVNVTTKALDTTAVGVHAVRYEVVVGDIVARQFRYITVKSPAVAEGEMLVNKDISQGVLGWNDPSVVYVADGAAMTLSAEAGQLKAVVVSGANSFTPRFGQMNIPFELGKTYEVSFDARSSVSKEISLQVGELLSGAPYFNDFLPSAEPFIFRTITTEMQRYSYKFTMTQDNQKGGILFGLGTVKGQDIDATMFFDNFSIVESTPDTDTTGPVISGAVSKTIKVGATFNPLTGVTAVDVTDGNVTSSMTVVIKDSDNTTVSSVDTSEPGTFTVTYTVSDSLNNRTVLAITITVEAEADLTYTDTNAFVDGTFTTTTTLPLEVQNSDNQDITENGFWYTYLANWGGAVATFAVVNGALEVDITNGFNEVWGVMVKQKGIELVANTTYRLTFTASATVDRNISVGFSPSSVIQVFGLTSTPTTYTLDFNYTAGTAVTRIEFLLGAGAAGKVTIDNVVLLEGGEPEEGTYTNTNEFVDGTFTTTTELPREIQNEAFQDIAQTGFWYYYLADWDSARATFAVVNGALEVDITNTFNQTWGVMIKQKGIDLVQNTTYRLTFTASSTVDRNISVGFNPSSVIQVFALTSTPTTYTLDFVFAGANVQTRIEFLLGTGPASKVTIDNIELLVAE